MISLSPASTASSLQCATQLHCFAAHRAPIQRLAARAGQTTAGLLSGSKGDHLAALSGRGDLA